MQKLKIYLASKFHNRKDAGMKKLAQNLKDAGHEIVSSWLRQKKEPNPKIKDDEKYRRMCAMKDKADLESSDVVVVWHRKMGAITGGAYWEMGYATAKNKPIVLVNPDSEPLRMIFALLNSVFHVKTGKEALELLEVLSPA